MTDFHIAFQKAIGAVSSMEPAEPEGGYAEGYADAKNEALAVMREAMAEELRKQLAELEARIASERRDAELERQIARVLAKSQLGRGIHIFRY